MREGPLTIAQVNASEQGGGAERVARQLLDDFRRRGHNASLLVGRGEALGPYALPFPADFRTRLAHILAGPLRILDRQRGLETFHYPATHRLLDTLPGDLDILHLHNLHGGYFDLRVLPELSRRHPLVLTLHDAWLLSGHCAHSIGCERWRTGCGSCPDLSIYPAIRRDATARNWKRKRDIFRRTRLHVAAPSAWLARDVERSILAPAVEDLRVIPNGVELDTFRPGDSRAARAELRLPDTGFLLLFVGSNVEVNGFKDYPTVRKAAAWVAEVLEEEVTLVVLGSAGTHVREGRARIQHIPFQSDPLRIALYYQACDLYLHAAHADTSPLTVLEALACGRPVVATAVGGIPEQVRCLAGGAEGGDWPSFDASDATGVLVEPADSEALAQAAERLLRDVPLRMKLGGNAARDAKLRFDARHQAGVYLEWYRTMEGPRLG